jgi:hypothetical protein
MAAPSTRPSSRSTKLDARLEIEKLRNLYKSDPRQQSYNILLTGEPGSGKTHLLKTARLPVHVDSFDPGGSKTNAEMIAKGDMIVDVSYEQEDPSRPTMYLKWQKDFMDRVNGGYFDLFGTYCLDSYTSWSEAIMQEVLRKSSRIDASPQFQDYHMETIQLIKFSKILAQLPCDVIVTAHLRPDYVGDKIIGYKLASRGRSQTVVPSLFDEVYVMEVKETSKGFDRKILTQSTGMYQAKTRIGGGKLNVREEPNIKKLLEKSGLSTEDKPPL